MRRILFLRSLMLGALLLSVAPGCRSTQSLFPAVAVREAQVRSDDLHLPLDQASRDHLIAFLGTGGDRDLLEEGDLVDLGAPQHYGPLLQLLSSEENLDPEDLEGPAFKPWFHSKPLREVIDARAARPPVADPPFAESDGTYWWVFSREGGTKLTRLVVFKAAHVPGEKEGLAR